MTPENPGLEMMKAAGEGAGRQGIDKIANALGAAFPFWGMRKKAVDVYVKAIENGNYAPDEKYMLIAGAKKHCKELENQMSIAEIAQQVAAEGTDFSMNSAVNDEFVSRIMDAGKHVSDEETQLLWGSVLAGEFETPGSTPWSVIRILSELTKEYSEIFSNLCSLQFELLADTGADIVLCGQFTMISATSDTPYLSNLGITYNALLELARFGLISVNFSGNNYKSFPAGLYKQFHLVTGHDIITISGTKDDKVYTGHVSLTEPGKCISQFTKRATNSAHLQATKEYLNKHGNQCASFPAIEITEVKETEAGTVYSFQRIPPEQQQTPKQQ